jgi:hypothetical protein
MNTCELKNSMTVGKGAVKSDAAKTLGTMALVGTLMADVDLEDIICERMEMQKIVEEHISVFDILFSIQRAFFKEDLLICFEFSNPDWNAFCISVCKKVEELRSNISQNLYEDFEIEYIAELDNGLIDGFAYVNFMKFAEYCVCDVSEEGMKMCLKFARDFLLRGAPEGFGKRNGSRLPNDHPFLKAWDEFSNKRRDFQRTLESEQEKSRRNYANSFGAFLADAKKQKAERVRVNAS